jgi:outer membrane protein OmpA-like peptidoglycan-associated protein
MTIVNAVIERGAKAWQVVKGVSTLIGTATNAGQMDIAFRDDPLIVAANVDPEPVAQPQQQVAVPVVVPVIEPPVVVAPIVAKTLKSQVKVFFGLGTAWLAPKEKNTLTKFVKDFAGKNQIVDVAVAGYTQPTLINPNPQKLSVDRAKAVVKALKALGINAKISATGKGNAKTNKPTSRYALLTITGTALK